MTPVTFPLSPFARLVALAGLLCLLAVRPLGVQAQVTPQTTRAYTALWQALSLEQQLTPRLQLQTILGYSLQLSTPRFPHQPTWGVYGFRQELRYQQHPRWLLSLGGFYSLNNQEGAREPDKVHEWRLYPRAVYLFKLGNVPAEIHARTDFRFFVTPAGQAFDFSGPFQLRNRGMLRVRIPVRGRTRFLLMNELLASSSTRRQADGHYALNRYRLVDNRFSAYYQCRPLKNTTLNLGGLYQYVLPNGASPSFEGLFFAIDFTVSGWLWEEEEKEPVGTD